VIGHQVIGQPAEKIHLDAWHTDAPQDNRDAQKMGFARAGRAAEEHLGGLGLQGSELLGVQRQIYFALNYHPTPPG
jgi:hypothetical protein